MSNSPPSSSRKDMVDRYSLPPIRDILGAHLSPSSSPRITENKYLSSTMQYNDLRHGRNVVQSNHHDVFANPNGHGSATNNFLVSQASSSKAFSRTTNPAGTFHSLSDQRSQESLYTVSTYGHKLPQNLPDILDFEESETEISGARNLLSVREATKTEADSVEGSPQYQCPYCLKLFTRPSGLKIHINVHTGEKPFQCLHPGCGRYFSVQSNMRRHMRIHMQDLKRQQDSALEEGEQAEVLLMPAPAFHG